MDKEKNPQKYHGMRYRIIFVGFFLDLSILYVMLFGGFTFNIKEISAGFSQNQIILNAIYITIFCFVIYVLHVPLNFFTGYTWEHKFGLSNQTVGQWLLDDLKKSVMGLILSIVLIGVIYWFLGAYPSRWWIWGGCFWMFLSVILARLTPNVIVPMFYKYTDIDNDALKQRIHQLFKDCKTSLKDIYAINFSEKTNKANAFICGFGGSRRVVLSDTLLNEFDEEEIETVVAHELGHYCHKDILKMLIINSIMIFLGLFLIDILLKVSIDYFGFQGLNDIASLPLVALAFSLFGLVLTPLSNWYSCRMERAADDFSLKMTGNPNVFISMMNKLGQMNLAEFEPNRFIELFFYDHPPIKKRIEFAQGFISKL